MRKERKKQIILWAGIIEKFIVSKIFHKFVNRAWETIEFKDSLEYNIEKIQTIIKRSALFELMDNLKQKKLFEAMSNQFQTRHSRTIFKKR